MKFLFGLLCVVSLLGCATFSTNPTARAFVTVAAQPAEALAAASLEAQIAALPPDPAEFHTWLLSAGLTEEEAEQVAGAALADVQLELSGLVNYIEGGAVGRLTLSALAGEVPALVGPREAARYLLARALAHPP